VVLAVLAAGGLSAVAGAVTWAGAAIQGVHVSLPRMLEAGSNCLPIAILFAGIATLAMGAVPRATAAVSYGLVTAAFLWYLVAALLGLPKWMVGLTPFQHIGLVPVQPYRVTAGIVMAGLGAGTAAAGLWLFRRRDIIGA
jgi:ABC-2 type transport system permease protein